MPKKTAKTSKPSIKQKKLILRRRGGKKREKHASMALYGYQKNVLKKRAAEAAKKRGYREMSVSYYLNMLMWKDWL